MISGDDGRAVARRALPDSQSLLNAVISNKHPDLVLTLQHYERPLGGGKLRTILPGVTSQCQHDFEAEGRTPLFFGQESRTFIVIVILFLT